MAGLPPEDSERVATMKAASPRMAVVLILVLGTLVGGLVEPLSSAHWDSPIYLYQAKRFAETDLAKSFATHSRTIAAQVSERSWPESETFPASFWRFMRLGNVAILGSVAGLADDPLTGMRLAGWVYACFLAAAAAMTFLAVRDLGTVFGVPDERAHTSAAAASAILYIASPIYWYLSANFLSEIPALFVLAATLLLFLRAALAQSVVLGICAGGLAAALYGVRMDSALTALALMVPLTAALRLKAPRYFSYRVTAATALTALLGFAAYSLYFYPLTDPRLVVALRQVLAEGPRASGVAGYHAVFVAGGLLWIGAAMALVSRRSLTLTALGLVWLVLTLLPRARGFSGTIHARILADVMPLRPGGPA